MEPFMIEFVIQINYFDALYNLRFPIDVAWENFDKLLGGFPQNQYNKVFCFYVKDLFLLLMVQVPTVSPS